MRAVVTPLARTAVAALGLPPPPQHLLPPGPPSSSGGEAGGEGGQDGDGGGAAVRPLPHGSLLPGGAAGGGGGGGGGGAGGGDPELQALVSEAQAAVYAYASGGTQAAATASKLLKALQVIIYAYIYRSGPRN